MSAAPIDHLLGQPSIGALRDPREVKTTLFEILMCPTCKRSGLIQDQNTFLECNCGSRFKKHQGILALRPKDKYKGTEGDLLDKPESNKYSQSGFVAGFTVRQYGGFLRYAENASPLPNDPSSQQLAESNKRCEDFYRALLSLAVPYLDRESVALDIGCGSGRLTGEMSRRSRLSIGIDFSPEMIKAASQIILENKNTDIRLQIPFSNSQTYEATVAGWERSNCAFVIADCMTLPIAARSIDVITCANLLHRIADPQKAINEIQRVLRPGGVLIVSNSYDWQKEFTNASDWFDSLTSVLSESDWHLQEELDWVPFTTPIFQRKTTTKYNHLQSFRKLGG